MTVVASKSTAALTTQPAVQRKADQRQKQGFHLYFHECEHPQ
jgi:hypothetical protein